MSVAEAAIGLSAAQRAAAALIEREFLAAGLPANLAAAAIVNALAESGLNPAARSKPPEDSVGLFQLNIRGAGAGMTTAQRQDPVTNTRRIIEVVRGRYGERLRSLARTLDTSTPSIAQLASLFAIDIERPANATAAGTLRAARAARLFPLGIGTANVQMVVRSAGVWWAVSGVVAVLVLGVLLLRNRSSTRSTVAPETAQPSLR